MVTIKLQLKVLKQNMHWAGMSMRAAPQFFQVSL